MHKRPIEYFIVDVFVSIDKINRFATTYTSIEEFEKAPEAIFDTTMRELETLGEAVNHLLKESTLSGIVSPRWRSIVAFRNVIAHEYFGIEVEEIFKVVKIHLPIFEQEFITCVERIPNRELLALAFDDASIELARRNRKESLAFLEKIRARLTV